MNCDLRRAQFEGVVLANVTLTEAVLGKNNFSASRLTDIMKLNSGTRRRRKQRHEVSADLYHLFWSG